MSATPPVTQAVNATLNLSIGGVQLSFPVTLILPVPLPGALTPAPAVALEPPA